MLREEVSNFILKGPPNFSVLELGGQQPPDNIRRLIFYSCTKTAGGAGEKAKHPLYY
jgi:hypothetical protein